MKFRDRALDESGAILVFVLAMMLILGVGIAALLGLSSTSFLASSGVREQRKMTYAADGAMDAAIEYARSVNGACGAPGAPDSPWASCPTFTMPTLNGVTVTVDFKSLTPPGLIDQTIDLTAKVDGNPRIKASVFIAHSDAKAPAYITKWEYLR